MDLARSGEWRCADKRERLMPEHGSVRVDGRDIDFIVAGNKASYDIPGEPDGRVTNSSKNINIVALAPIQIVASRAAVEPVVAVLPVELVVSAASMQSIVASTPV